MLLSKAIARLTEIMESRGDIHLVTGYDEDHVYPNKILRFGVTATCQEGCTALDELVVVIRSAIEIDKHRTDRGECNLPADTDLTILIGTPSSDGAILLPLRV